MANLTTTADIKQDVLQKCGELTNGTSPYDALVLDYINRVHMELVVGGSTFVPELAEPWPWARAAKPGLVVLQPAFTSDQGGSVTVTQGSLTGSFAVAPSASLGSFVGRFLFVFSQQDVYRIATHTAGSSTFTLDLAWQLPTTTAGFRCCQLDYALSQAAGITRLVEPFRIFALQTWDSDHDGKVQGLSSDQLHRRFPLYLFGLMPFRAPTHFATISETNNSPTVRFNTCVDTPTRIEYEYIPIPADLTLVNPSIDPLPLIPREHRSVLSFGAAYWLMVDKEDSRADLYQRYTQAKIQAMLMERRREFDDQTADFAKLNPRQDHYWRPFPRSTSGLWFP